MSTATAAATITPGGVGSLTVDSSLNCYLTDPGQAQTVPLCAYLLEAGGERYLVDTGAPPELVCAQSYRPLVPGSQRSLARAFPAGAMDALSGVILTHLHWDHAGGLSAIPDHVPVYVQAEEAEYARQPLPVHRRGYGLEMPAGHTPWWEQRTGLTLLDGDTDLPGNVRLLLTPGHSPGSQTVIADAGGHCAVLPGDTVPTARNWHANIPCGVHTSLADWYQSMDRLRSIATVVYPGHGPMFAAAAKHQQP